MSTATHFNDLSAAVIRHTFPDAEVFDQGDCGNVWGEHHDDCPYPHVIVKDATNALLLAARASGHGAVVTDWDDWSIEVADHGWIEDDHCPVRVHRHWWQRVRDYRKPYVPRV